MIVDAAPQYEHNWIERGRGGEGRGGEGSDMPLYMVVIIL